MRNFSNPTALTTSRNSQEAKNGISIIIPAYNERDRIKKDFDEYKVTHPKNLDGANGKTHKFKSETKN